MYYIFTNDDSFNILLFTIFSDVERAGAAICTNSVVQIMCVEERRERRMGEASLGNTSYPCLFHRSHGNYSLPG